MEEVVTDVEPSSDYLKVEMVVTARCLDCDNTDCEHALATARRIGDELLRYARLKDAVCEAAKNLFTLRFQPHFGGITVLENELQESTRALIEFESNQIKK